MGNVEYCTRCMNPLKQGKFCTHCGKNKNDKSHLAHALPPGTLLHDRYLIGDVIGQGGFGITYIGRDMVLDSTVAVKECYPSTLVARMAGSLTVTPSSARTAPAFTKCEERFTGEARLLRKMSDNKSVVDVLDFFQDNGTSYMVMEMLRGRTLEEELAAGPMKAEAVFSMMEPVLDALQEMHSIGLLHRDLSPDNIMITQANHAVLMDFGAARTVDLDSQNSLSVVLKPSFAPAEQYERNGKQGPWSDIYALCATMYRSITGSVPQNALKRLADDNLKAPSQLGISISPAQEQALMRGLSVKPENRQKSARQLKEELLGLKPATQNHQSNAAQDAKADSPIANAQADIPVDGRQTIAMTKTGASANASAPKGNPERNANPADRGIGVDAQATKPASSASGKQASGKKIPVIIGIAVVLIAVIAFAIFQVGNHLPSRSNAASSQLIELSPNIEVKDGTKVTVVTEGSDDEDVVSLKELGRCEKDGKQYKVMEATNNADHPMWISALSDATPSDPDTHASCNVDGDSEVMNPGESSLVIFSYDDMGDLNFNCEDKYEVQEPISRESIKQDVQIDSNAQGGSVEASTTYNGSEKAFVILHCLFYKDGQLVRFEEDSFYCDGENPSQSSSFTPNVDFDSYEIKFSATTKHD